MRTSIATAFVILSLSSLGALGQGRPPVSVFSYDDTSCGAWVKSADVTWIRAQYYSWFRGFVSGYNLGNPGNQVQLGQMPNEQTLYLFIDKYCRDHPLNPFVSAAFKLVEELREQPGPSKTDGR